MKPGSLSRPYTGHRDLPRYTRKARRIPQAACFKQGSSIGKSESTIKEMMVACIDYIFYLEKFKVTRILSNPRYDKTLDKLDFTVVLSCRRLKEEQKGTAGKHRHATDGKKHAMSANTSMRQIAITCYSRQTPARSATLASSSRQHWHVTYYILYKGHVRNFVLIANAAVIVLTTLTFPCGCRLGG